MLIITGCILAVLCLLAMLYQISQGRLADALGMLLCIVLVVGGWYYWANRIVDTMRDSGNSPAPVSSVAESAKK